MFPPTSVGQCADGQREVDRQRLADLENQAAPIEVPEARQRCREPVTAGCQGRHEVTAILATHDLPKHAGLFIGENDHDAGQDSALFVRGTPPDVCCPLLS